MEKKSTSSSLPTTRFVFVVDHEQKPLMPTTPARARRFVKEKKATPFWDHGLFCIRLNAPPSGRYLQPVAAGVDPGSRFEGLTFKSAAHTYLNLQADAVVDVQTKVTTRREMRRARRFRKTPCRKNRTNRRRGGLPPSTKARWDWKLRLLAWVGRRLPLQVFVVEDIQAKTKGKRRWDASFSPLEVGKAFFYDELRKRGELVLKKGYETKALRDELGLSKTKDKKAAVFEAHCVDSWVLARSVVGGGEEPENTELLLVSPLVLHRRQLHRLQPSKGGGRSPYGSTRSHGFKRGALVKHPKHGVCYVGGVQNDRLSLHDIKTAKRLCQNARPKETHFLSYNTRRARFLPL